MPHLDDTGMSFVIDNGTVIDCSFIEDECDPFPINEIEDFKKETDSYIDIALKKVDDYEMNSVSY